MFAVSVNAHVDDVCPIATTAAPAATYMYNTRMLYQRETVAFTSSEFKGVETGARLPLNSCRLVSKVDFKTELVKSSGSDLT